MKDKLLLYLKKNWGCNCVSKFWKNGHKFEKIYEKGQARIDHELNIVRFMNNLRNVKILLKASLMKDPEVKTQVKHNKKNLIEIDDQDERPKNALLKTLTMMMRKKLLGNKGITKKVELGGMNTQPPPPPPPIEKQKKRKDLSNSDDSYIFSEEESAESEQKTERAPPIQTLPTPATSKPPLDILSIYEKTLMEVTQNKGDIESADQIDLEEQILKESSLK